MTTSPAYLANGGYPPDWKEVSQQIREERAGNQCEWMEADGSRCPRKHHEPIPGKEYAQTVLTVAHINHTPSDCRPENLAAWCQAHHLRYDAPMHAKHAQQTLKRKKRESALAAGQIPMLEGVSDA